jgi:hypothetical protein
VCVYACVCVTGEGGGQWGTILSETVMKRPNDEVEGNDADEVHGKHAAEIVHYDVLAAQNGDLRVLGGSVSSQPPYAR